MIVLSNITSFKHEKVRNEICHHDAIKWNVKPKLPQQTSFGILFMEIGKNRVLRRFCVKTAERCSQKTCVKFGRCYGNQGWEEAVEITLCLKMRLFKLSKSFKSLAQGVLEILGEVCLGGGGGDNALPPPPRNLVGIGLMGDVCQL